MRRAGTADTVDDGRALDRVRLRVAAGSPPGDLSDLPARTADLLRVATDVGAPLLDTLDAAAASDDDRRRAERAVAVASAQGRAVATGLVLAPMVLVPAMSRLFDVDLVAYHRTPLGAVTGTLGVTLLVAGVATARAVIGRIGRPPRTPSRVTRRLVGLVGATLVTVAVHPVAGVIVLGLAIRRGRPRPAPVDPRLADAADAAAVAVAGGLPPSAALRVAASEVRPLALPLRRLAFDLENGPAHGHGLEGGVDRLADVLRTADAVGAPVGPTLRRLAADVRADDLARVLAAAERLPVQLTFPTALCLLPGVLLLVGAPIVQAGLAAAGT